MAVLTFWPFFTEFFGIIYWHGSPMQHRIGDMFEIVPRNNEQIVEQLFYDSMNSQFYEQLRFFKM